MRANYGSPSCGGLGPPWDGLGLFWSRPGAILERLGTVVGRLGPSWGVLGRLYVGRRGALCSRHRVLTIGWGPGGVLGRSWAAWGRSWAILEPSWGLGAFWAVLEAIWGLLELSGCPKKAPSVKIFNEDLHAGSPRRFSEAPGGALGSLLKLWDGPRPPQDGFQTAPKRPKTPPRPRPIVSTE